MVIIPLLNEMEVSVVQMKTLKIILFYLVSFTWGALMSVIGLLVGLALMIGGVKPKLYGHVVYFEVGKGWGGLELGCFFLCSKNCGDHTKKHECGHGIQNTWFGPLMPFLVCLPSAYRYWMYEVPSKNLKTFAAVVLVVALLLGCGLIMLGLLLLNSWFLAAIGILIAVYFIILTAWAWFFEIPKHQAPGYVPYDSIWFEGQATKLGYKYFPTQK